MTIWIAAGAFFLWALLSATSLGAAIHLLSLVIFFLLGYQRRLTWLWQALPIVLTLNLAIVLFIPSMPYGLAGNPNYFGVAIALGLAGALAYRVYWFIPISAVGLWACQSRTALIGAAVAFFLAGIRRFPATAMCTALLCILVLILIQKGAESFSQRLGIWHMAVLNMKPLGHGWGSFTAAIDALPVKINLTAMLAPAAYNDFLQLCFELGIGVIPLIIFVAICFEGHDEGSCLILWTYAAMSLTYFPLWIPFVGPFVAMALGRLAVSRLERKPLWQDGYLKSHTI